jgi:hypothetical protein
MRRPYIRALLPLLCLGGAVTPALAWDGVQTMIPGSIDVTASDNLGFMVWGPSCNGVQNFAYLVGPDSKVAAADSNYQAYVAVILLAKAQGLTVTFYTTKDSNGYCHLGYITQN